MIWGEELLWTSDANVLIDSNCQKYIEIFTIMLCRRKYDLIVHYYCELRKKMV